MRAVRPTRKPVALWLAVPLLAAGCGGGQAQDASEPVADESSRVVIKVASGQMIPRAGIDIAMARGYFDEENLDIEIEDIATGPDQVPLMASGQIDVAITGPSAAHFNALAAGIPVRFVAPCGSSDSAGEVPNGMFAVRKSLFDSGEVTKVEDFRGLKVGVPNRESKGFVDAATLLEQAGLSVDDVEIVAPLGFPDAAAALAGGAVDVAFLVEPFATLGEMKGETVIVAGDHEIMPGRLGCALAFGKRLVTDEALGDRFMRAYLRGVRDYHDAFFNNEDKASIVEIETKVTPVTDPTLFDKIVPNYIDPNGEINVDSLELDIERYHEQGYLSETPDIDSILEPGFAERAVAELGRYDVTK